MAGWMRHEMGIWRLPVHVRLKEIRVSILAKRTMAMAMAMAVLTH